MIFWKVNVGITPDAFTRKAALKGWEERERERGRRKGGREEGRKGGREEGRKGRKGRNGRKGRSGGGEGVDWRGEERRVGQWERVTICFTFLFSTILLSLIIGVCATRSRRFFFF